MRLKNYSKNIITKKTMQEKRLHPICLQSPYSQAFTRKQSAPLYKSIQSHNRKEQKS